MVIVSDLGETRAVRGDDDAIVSLRGGQARSNRLRARLALAVWAPGIVAGSYYHRSVPHGLRWIAPCSHQRWRRDVETLVQEDWVRLSGSPLVSHCMLIKLAATYTYAVQVPMKDTGEAVSRSRNSSVPSDGSVVVV